VQGVAETERKKENLVKYKAEAKKKHRCMEEARWTNHATMD
jgi:hypothetical protein